MRRIASSSHGTADSTPLRQQGMWHQLHGHWILSLQSPSSCAAQTTQDKSSSPPTFHPPDCLKGNLRATFSQVTRPDPKHSVLCFRLWSKGNKGPKASTSRLWRLSVSTDKLRKVGSPLRIKKALWRRYQSQTYWVSQKSHFPTALLHTHPLTVYISSDL